MASTPTAELSSSPGGAWALRGELTFDTVPALWRESARLLAGAVTDGRVTLDLAGVARTDSAGLALLVAWQGQALAAGHRLHFEGIPERLLAIARISDAESLLTAP